MRYKIKNRHIARFVDMVLSLSHLDVPAYAGNASFFIFLAAVPTTMLLLNILSYTSLRDVVLLEVLSDLLPEALIPTVTSLLERMFSSSSTTLVSVTAFTSLWAASRGVYSILVGLNRVYGVREERTYIYTRCISVIYTFLFLVVLLLTLVLYVFRNALLAWLGKSPIPAVCFLTRVLSNYLPIVVLLQIGLFTMMFMFMPNRHNQFISSLPGAIVATLGWQLFSYGFSIYVSNFSKYSTIYGSLATMAIAMFWLYTCIAIIFYGGAFNKYLSDIGYEMRRKKRQRNEAKRARQLLEQSKDDKNPQ